MQDVIYRMIEMKRLFFILACMAFVCKTYGQQENLSNSVTPIQDGPPVDGYYEKSDIENRKVIPYSHIRSVDVMYSKRVWREIDLRDRLNASFASPKSRLIDILMKAIMAGELTAYDPIPTKEDPNGDSFKTPLDPSKLMSNIADSVFVPEFDNEGNQIGGQFQSGEFNTDSIFKFRIKEDWIFDKQRSVFEPRIIGIAPLIPIKAADVYLDPQPAFWVYFPEARHILVNKEVVNRNNDATGLSYDDVFIKRIFSSYVVKQSNPEDLRIKDYKEGVDRLYESEKIKQTLLNYEHDLWSY
ncbi:gliding motility associated protien GldN [Olivibacter domesticus]|uniref:Gliding motility associated protien GldN n=2 Tax=Olivibacter domesticus TaxID=407022 RepID=A0A1H7X8Z7_OLID1|nr:gliding motility associated protien GldN [Olivibacter domesticus]